MHTNMYIKRREVNTIKERVELLAACQKLTIVAIGSRRLFSFAIGSHGLNVFAIGSRCFFLADISSIYFFLVFSFTIFIYRLPISRNKQPVPRDIRWTKDI